MRKTGEVRKLFHGKRKIVSMGKFHLTFLGYESEQHHVAHCLELDIVAQCPSSEEAVNDLVELIKDQVAFAAKHDIEENIFHPAPKEYWNKLDEIKIHQTEQRLPNVINRLVSSSKEDILKHAEFVSAQR